MKSIIIKIYKFFHVNFVTVFPIYQFYVPFDFYFASYTNQNNLFTCCSRYSYYFNYYFYSCNKRMWRRFEEIFWVRNVEKMAAFNLIYAKAFYSSCKHQCGIKVLNFAQTNQHSYDLCFFVKNELRLNCKHTEVCLNDFDIFFVSR